MKLIDKDKVAEEIKRKLNSYHPTEITSGRYALQDLLSFLDTLEVKEVNLEKEVNSQMDLLCNLLCYMDELSNGDSEGVYPLPINVIEDLQRFAKYFFKLGMQQGKGNKI